MTTYLFKGSGTEIFLDTDASDDHKEFFAVDVRGEDTYDIAKNIILRIQMYSEYDLIEFAQSKNLSLYSYDPLRGERVVYAHQEAYGVFNATTSKVAYDVTIPDVSAEITPLVFEYDAKFLAETNPTAPATIRPVIDVETPDIDIVGIVTRGSNLGVTQIGPFTFGGTPLTPTFEIGDDTWRHFKYIVPISGNKTFELDGLVLPGNSGTGPGVANWSQVFTTNQVTGTIGTDQTDVPHFVGGLKNIKFFIGTKLILDIPDPYTGINIVGNGNGVVTDVTQGT